MRYAISCQEEIWVRCCYKFFEEYGFGNFYQVPKEKAFAIIMKNSNGSANPDFIKERIEKLYKDVGAKNEK